MPTKFCSSLVCLFVGWTLSHSLSFCLCFYIWSQLPNTHAHKHLSRVRAIDIQRLNDCMSVFLLPLLRLMFFSSFFFSSLLHSFSLHFCIWCVYFLSVWLWLCLCLCCECMSWVYRLYFYKRHTRASERSANLNTHKNQHRKSELSPPKLKQKTTHRASDKSNQIQ